MRNSEVTINERFIRYTRFGTTSIATLEKNTILKLKPCFFPSILKLLQDFIFIKIFIYLSAYLYSYLYMHIGTHIYLQILYEYPTTACKCCGYYRPWKETAEGLSFIKNRNYFGDYQIHTFFSIAFEFFWDTSLLVIETLNSKNAKWEERLEIGKRWMTGKKSLRTRTIV